MTRPLITETLTVAGQARRFSLTLPTRRDDPVLPLVVVLHGNMSQAPDEVRAHGGLIMRDSTTFDEQADAWGVAVAYPDGLGGSWADGRGVSAAEAAGADDVAFLRALVEWCAARHGTIADRTIVAGISNGGFMSHRFALEAGDLVAAFAAVAAALPETHVAITPHHAVSALLINGSADPLVSLDGGYSRHRGPNGELRGRILSQRETTAHWIGVNRCTGDETISTTTPSGEANVFGMTRQLVARGVAGTAVATWTIHGGGHTWPGFVPVPEEFTAVVGPTSRNFDTAAEICRFALPALASAADRRL